MNWAPLLELRRNGIPEVVVHGAINWVRGDRIVHTYGGDPFLYGRSLMKPYQLKVFAKELQSRISRESQAVAVASHMAEPEQLRAAQAILPSGEWESLLVPPSHPLGNHEAEALKKVPQRWNHPCSGKHAAIVLGCQLKGWPVEGYTALEHPYYAAYLNEVRRALGADWKPAVVAVDGCGLPTVAMRLSELARTYEALARFRDDDWIWSVMVEHPDLVGGKGRLDTSILKACRGEGLAKEGADGLLGLSMCDSQFPQRWGVVIKIAHGWDPRSTAFLAHVVLSAWGYEFRATPQLEGQTAWVSSEILPPNLRSKWRGASSNESGSRSSSLWRRVF